jgi:hypothetical protein
MGQVQCSEEGLFLTVQTLFSRWVGNARPDFAHPSHLENGVTLSGRAVTARSSPAIHRWDHLTEGRPPSFETAAWVAPDEVLVGGGLGFSAKGARLH